MQTRRFYALVDRIREAEHNAPPKKGAADTTETLNVQAIAGIMVKTMRDLDGLGHQRPCALNHCEIGDGVVAADIPANWARRIVTEAAGD